jgi:RimJ/RimL family protein N-acetyltransferase
MMAAIADLRFVPLSSSLAGAIESWFDDRETARFLGGREWVWNELWLARQAPGSEYLAPTVRRRCAWVAFEDAIPVGELTVEVYDDHRAAPVVVVAPELRGRGFGRAILEAMWTLPALAGVQEVFGGVEPENAASRCCLEAAGFTVSPDLDDEDMLAVTRARAA